MPRRKKIELGDDENKVKTMVKEWYDQRKAWHYAATQSGLGTSGIHDRVGSVPITITQDMVGKTFGLFVSVESKRPGRRAEKNRGMSPAQHAHMIAILETGGVAICCDGGEDDFAVLNYLTRGSISG